MSNAGNENGLQRLEVIRKLNGENREWDNSELYRLMYKQDLYILAYERIKSHPGNMTPGTDDETLDGFSTGDDRGTHPGNEDREIPTANPSARYIFPRAMGRCAS